MAVISTVKKALSWSYHQLVVPVILLSVLKEQIDVFVFWFVKTMPVLAEKGIALVIKRRFAFWAYEYTHRLLLYLLLEWRVKNEKWKSKNLPEFAREGFWQGWQGSNLYYRSQSPVCCRYTTSLNLTHYIIKFGLCQEVLRFFSHVMLICQW